MSAWKNIGYLWAALAVPAVLLTMRYNERLSRELVAATGVSISPRFSGGAVERTVDHGRYLTSIHRPVFDGLTGQRDEGFIQVDWTPAARLPETVREELDVFGKGEKFTVVLNTAEGRALCENGPAYVAGEPMTTRYRSGWAVRIGLKKRGLEGQREK